MSAAFIILHVLAAILFLGPVTVAVSTFQKHALAAKNGDERAAGTAQNLHRITQTYGYLSALVPGFGFLIMFADSSFWSDMRIIVGIVLSAIAWGILLLLIIPRQKKMLGELNLLGAGEADPSDHVADWEKAKKQLSMFGGIFAALWVLTALAMLG